MKCCGSMRIPSRFITYWGRHRSSCWRKGCCTLRPMRRMARSRCRCVIIRIKVRGVWVRMILRSFVLGAGYSCLWRISLTRLISPMRTNPTPPSSLYTTFSYNRGNTKESPSTSKLSKLSSNQTTSSASALKIKPGYKYNPTSNNPPTSQRSPNRGNNLWTCWVFNSNSHLRSWT